MTNSKNRNFFVVAFIIGLAITSVLGFGFFAFYHFAPNYSQELQYDYFFVVANQSSNFQPTKFHIFLNMFDDSRLQFDYEFSITDNGTYNFIFHFPFKIIEKIDSSNGMNFTVTPYGTAVWVSYEIADVHEEENHHVSGYYKIADTFRSGQRGNYVFSLPLTFSSSSFEPIDSLKDELGVSWQYTNTEISIGLYVPSSLQFTQYFPEPDSLDSYMWGKSNKTINRINWYLDGFHELQKRFTVFCEDQTEISKFEFMLFISGIFISIGSSLMVTSTYDYFKKKS